MTKTSWMGAVVAILLMGCGGDEPDTTDEALGRGEGAEVASEFCGEVEQAVASVRDGLGNCTPNYKNQEPLAFSRSVCDAQLSTACDAAAMEHARQYVECLRAVEACVPAQQSLFDEAIDDCLDTFQNSEASEECIELVVGD